MSTTGRTTSTYSVAAIRKAGQLAAAKRDAERDAARADREADHVAKQNQIQKRVGELAAYLFDQLPKPEDIERLPMLAGSTMFAIARPPSKERVEINGSMERVPRHPAAQTHFSGYEGGKLADPESNGYPMVALLQGFRTKGPDGKLGESDPKTLPNGQTAIDRLNAMLIEALPADESPDNAACVRVHWNARPDGVEDGRLEIRLVWDLDAWNAWNAKRAEKQKRNERGHGRGGRGGGRRERLLGASDDVESRQLTIDEYMARSAKRTYRPRTPPGPPPPPPPPKEGETCIPVRGRRRVPPVHRQ